MPLESLGTLERVDPTTLWGHEAHDLTPWLLENTDGLADALGIDVELEATEHRVGTFSLDLLGKDLTNGTILMVENQLAGTDHSHLGQILTYAAGTGAATIVWIATTFREEHRQALDWLNEQTGEGVHFFGLQLEAFRIKGSEPAPHFKMVVEPNDWQKAIRSAAHSQVHSGKAALYADFWELFLERLAAEEPRWTRRRSGRTAVAQNWLDMPSPLQGTSLNVSFARGGRLRHELYIDSGEETANQTIFETLLGQQETLERAYGGELAFEALEGRRAARIAAYSEGDVADTSQHEVFASWFIDSGRRLRRAIGTIELP